MSAHADFSAQFSSWLLAPTFACPPGLKSWNGSDPAKRFAVYRNNVVVGLVDALADSYPVVQALVGEEFFRAMAGVFVRQAPPRSPVLAWYGAGFAGFVEVFPPAAGLPYLPDVARLEWLRVEAWHAADADALPLDELAALLADDERLPATRFAWHPAARVMASAHPIASLWAAHQSDDPAAALADIDMTRAEAALLVRPELEVEIIPLAADAADFIRRLQSGASLGTAAASSAGLDLPATLGLLIRSGALVDILATENAS
jgi:hypothetical protein